MTVIETAQTAEQLRATLDDPDKLNTLINSEGGIAQFVEDYVSNGVDKARIELDIENQVKATMTELAQDGAFDQAVEQQVSPEEMAARMTAAVNDGGAGYNPDAPGVALNELAASDVIQAAFHRADTLTNSADLMAAASKIHQVQNAAFTHRPSDGGLLIPETMRSVIAQLALEQAIVRRKATVIKMGPGTLSIPSVEGGSNVSSIFGGIQAYWEDEGEELTESKASFKAVKLDPKKLTILAEFTNEMIADAQAVVTWFMRNVPAAMAWFEDCALFDGDGVNKPSGWMNAGCGVTVAPEGGQASNTIELRNLTNMYSRMLPSSLGTAEWYISQEAFPELAELKIDAGSGAIWINNTQEGPPATIFGRPVNVTEKVPGLGSEGDINFADLRYQVIGDRQAVEITSSPHQKFTADRTLYKVTQRVDSKTWLTSPVTPKNGTQTLSPIVKLGGRP